MSSQTPWTTDSPWPPDDPGFLPDDGDELAPWEINDEYWEALLPDDDYEPLPEYGDFWTDE